jgi:hypothetical protein
MINLETSLTLKQLKRIYRCWEQPDYIQTHSCGLVETCEVLHFNIRGSAHSGQYDGVLSFLKDIIVKRELDTLIQE